MQKNLVPLDRAMRLGGGLFLLATPLLDLHTYPYNLLGIIPIATAIAGFCPLYVFGRRLLPAGRDGAALPSSNAGRGSIGGSQGAAIP